MRDPRSNSAARFARKAALAAPILAAFLTPACATMFAPGPDMVPVNSVPEGARVSLDGVPVGRTPCTVAFNRPGEGVLKFDAPGYESATVDRDKVLNGMFIVNILWGMLSPIPFAIDLAASNQGRYSATPVYVELLSVTTTPSSHAVPSR